MVMRHSVRAALDPVDPFANKMGLVDRLSPQAVRPALDRLPQTVFEAIQFYRDRRILFTLNLSVGGPRWVSQPALLEMLAEQSSHFPSFQILRGARVRDLLRENGRVRGVRYASADGERELRGDLVIGTDGRDSTVRRQAGLLLESHPQKFDVVWCKMPPPAPIVDRGIVRVFLGAGHFVLVLPSYDGRLQIGWIIDKGSFGALHRLGISEWVREMAEHVTPDLGAHFRRHVADVTHPFLLNVISGCSREWTLPGLLLLGDAAHPMSPVGGQGINIALRDSLVAANRLCPVLSSDPGWGRIDAAADQVQVERLPEVVLIQRLQQLPPRLLLSGSWRSRLALHAVTSLVRTGLVRPLFAPIARRIANGVTRVRLEAC